MRGKKDGVRFSLVLTVTLLLIFAVSLTVSIFLSLQYRARYGEGLSCVHGCASFIDM